MSCDWCGHTDGDHLESVETGGPDRCFADDCECEVASENLRAVRA